MGPALGQGPLDRADRPADPDAWAPRGRAEPVIVQVQEPPKGKEPPKAKEPPPKLDLGPDTVARTDVSGEAPEGYFSRMLGDQIGAVYATQLVTLPGTQVVTQTLTTTQTTIQQVPGPDGQTIRREVEHHGVAASVLPYDPMRRTAIARS